MTTQTEVSTVLRELWEWVEGEQASIKLRREREERENGRTTHFHEYLHGQYDAFRIVAAHIKLDPRFVAPL